MAVTARRYPARVAREDRFEMVADFAPAGDQPQAIAGLSEGLAAGEKFQTLLGITGSGKSATIGWTIEQFQRPTLVMAPNKSLAAQLANEFRAFFPKNKVEYFVSYYDYYQPEAYLPSSDTYIEKDSSVNDEIERLRHATTASLLTRRDVIVVASVSAIYGLGSPEEYRNQLLYVRVGEEHDMRSILRKLVDIRYERNDLNLTRGRFRVRGDTLEVHPAYEEHAVRIEMFGDEIERIVAGRPAHRRAARCRRRADDPAGQPLRHRRRADAPGHPAHRGRAAGAAEGVRGAGQAARGPAPAHAHQLRPGDDAGGRLLQRDRELLRPHRRSGPGRGPQHPARLLPRRLPDGAGRVPRHGPPAPRPVRRGPQPQGDPRRARLPPAVGGRQPAPDLRRVHGQGEPGRVPVGHPQPVGGGALQPGWWSRSSAPPASSTPRSS